MPSQYIEDVIAHNRQRIDDARPIMTAPRNGDKQWRQDMQSSYCYAPHRPEFFPQCNRAPSLQGFVE